MCHPEEEIAHFAIKIQDHPCGIARQTDAQGIPVVLIPPPERRYEVDAKQLGTDSIVATLITEDGGVTKTYKAILPVEVTIVNVILSPL